MQIEVWSDVVCPWCYIGKRRLEAAVSRFEEPVDVVWRSFELDPGAPALREGPLDESLARKYRVPVSAARAMMQRVVQVADAEGLDFDFERAQTGNTFDSHRLIHHAAARGRGAEMKERLLRAYFCEGRPVSEKETLVGLAIEVGLVEEDVRIMLGTNEYAADVRADEARAAKVGAHGVPFFLIDEAYGVSGAQEVETLVAVLRQVSALRSSTPEGGSCGPDGC